MNTNLTVIVNRCCLKQSCDLYTQEISSKLKQSDFLTRNCDTFCIVFIPRQIYGKHIFFRKIKYIDAIIDYRVLSFTLLQYCNTTLLSNSEFPTLLMAG